MFNIIFASNIKKLKKIILFIFLAFTAFSCKQKDPYATEDFDNFKNRFVDAMWQMYPGWATAAGYHAYDSILVIPDENFRKRELDFCKTYLDSLHSFNVDDLNPNNKIDYKIIENQLKAAEWNNKEFKDYEWNPSYYNVAEGFATIITEKYDKLENRLRSAGKRLDNVAAYYEVAKRQIKRPTKEHTDLALQQNSGALDVFQKLLPDSVKASALPENEKQEILKKAEKALQAVNSYMLWLQNDLKPSLNESNSRSFRIGKELYAEKFKYDIVSSFSAEEMYKKAVERKKEVHHEMVKISRQMWPQYFKNTPMPQDSLKMVRMMIDTLSVDHVQRDSFQKAIEAQLPELIQFIKDKNLLYIDPAKPLVVRTAPAYLQGIAGVSISAPGPYDKMGNTYYNVSPLNNYSDKEAESYLREYNKYILQILNIHEAIPGHYTQLVYSNQSPSLIKSIFGNGAMVEGWAVYTERMMLEEGYGNNDPAMWLMYYKWHIRTVCNTILDYSVHVNNMSEQDAMNLLMNEAFQQEAEAKGKWRRVSLTQVQLTSYFSGYSEIYALREELKEKMGDKFNLKEFHEKFLSYGSAPVKYIRELMLKELDK